MSQVREAMEKLGSAIAADPSKAQAKRAPATARLVDGLRCEITGPYAEKVMTDMPPAIGGAGSAPSPGWLFRGALASCTATVIAMRAAKLGIALKTDEGAHRRRRFARCVARDRGVGRRAFAGGLHGPQRPGRLARG
jgi:hypothetical protein